MAGSRQSLHVVPPDYLGARLKSKRREDDLTQGDLAERFGVAQQTVGAWERGERPQNRFFGPLASYLGLSDERELMSLLESQADPAAGQSAVGIDGPSATDGEAMRQLAWQFVQDQQRGHLSAAEAGVYQSLIAYFQTRATDAKES